jgi:hypothetical protein
MFLKWLCTCVDLLWTICRGVEQIHFDSQDVHLRIDTEKGWMFLKHVYCTYDGLHCYTYYAMHCNGTAPNELGNLLPSTGPGKFNNFVEFPIFAPANRKSIPNIF